MANPKTRDGVKLTKDEVLGRFADGVYAQFPEYYPQDALGYVLDEWQNRSIRKLLIGSNAPEGSNIYSWFPEKKARLAVRAGHGLGKCITNCDIVILSNGSIVRAENLIGKSFLIPSLNKELKVINTLAIAADNGMQQTWEITTDDGRKIKRTSNHPLWHIPCQFQSGHRPKFGQQQWKSVSELKVGDLICSSEYLPVEGNSPMEDWEVKILGHLIGDGCLTGSSIQYSQSPNLACQEVREICSNLGLILKTGSRESSFTIVKGPNSQTNYIIDLVRRMGIFGNRSENHIIPANLWQVPNRQLSLFLSRLFSADGWACVTKPGKKTNGEPKLRHEIGYVSKSEQLIRDVHLACLRFGIAGKIRQVEKYWTHKGIRKSNLYWIWTIHDTRSTLKFIKEIGIFGKEKACQKVKECAEREFDRQRNSAPTRYAEPWEGEEKRALKWMFHKLPNGLRWEKIVSITYLGELPTVAIEVPETHEYLGLFREHNSFLSGVLTHTFLGLYLPSIVVCTGPTGKQTSRQLWQYITTCHSRSVFKDDIEMFGTTMKWKANPSQWFATWLTSKEPKSIEGFHGPDEGENILWIVEESKGVENAVFEAIQGALSHKNNFWYISSTCGTANGFFFDAFHSKADLWENEKATYKDSTRVSHDQIDKWAQQWGRESSIFKARVMAEFPEEDDKILVPLSWCERAIRQPQLEDE